MWAEYKYLGLSCQAYVDILSTISIKLTENEDSQDQRTQGKEGFQKARSGQ